MEVLRATSAMPFVAKIIEIENNKYLDGGLTDSIPLEKCKELGYDKIIVVLTRPIDYRKKPLSSKLLKFVELKYRKYPNFIETMKKRYIDYNQTVETIIDLENKKEIFVIRPTKPIHLSAIVRNPDDLQEVYDLGVHDGLNRIEELKEYLK